MESTAKQMRGAQSGVAPADFEEALGRVAAYLGAWRIGDADRVRHCAQQIVAQAQKKIASGAQNDLLRTAIEEAGSFLTRLHAELGTPDQKAAILFGAPADADWNLSDRLQSLAAAKQGSLNFGAALRPTRAPETRAFTMKTSLSRLPSIRLIAGWMILIALLFLGFVLTHHRI